MCRSHGKTILTISVKKLFKNVEKPLDKLQKMCYNTITKRKREVNKMDFKCVSVFSTEELMNLKNEVEKVLNARRGQEAQKIWDTIMTNFRALYDMGATNTMVTDNETLEEVFYQFNSKPEWEFDNDD